MTNFSKKVLLQHKEMLLDAIENGIVHEGNLEDMHHHAFNESYFVYSHLEAKKWLSENKVDAFDAIEIVAEYEKYMFGEVTTDIKPQNIVNMLSYIIGEEVCSEFQESSIEEIIEALEEELVKAA